MKKTTKTICIALFAGITGIVFAPIALKGSSTAPSDKIQSTASLSAAQITKKEVCGLPLAKDAEQSYKRMFVHNGKLYIDTGETSSGARCGTMDGQITKTVAADKVPKKENQSNFGKYGFQYGRRKNRLEVLIDDTWHIFAYNENNLDGVTMSVVKNGPRFAKLSVTNSTDREIIFGEDYELEKKNKKTGEWKSVDYIIDNAAFNDIAFLPEKNKPMTWKVNWKTFHGTLKPGTYRIVKRFLDFKETGKYTEYTLMSEFKVSA